MSRERCGPTLEKKEGREKGKIGCAENLSSQKTKKREKKVASRKKKNGGENMWGLTVRENEKAAGKGKK